MAATFTLSGTACSKEAITARYDVKLTLKRDRESFSGGSVWAISLTCAGNDPEFQGYAFPITTDNEVYWALLAGAHDGAFPDAAQPSMYPRMLFGDGARALAGERPRFTSAAADLADVGARVGETRLVDCSKTEEIACPLIVRFSDPDDPRSLEIVSYRELKERGFTSTLKITITQEEISEAPEFADLPVMKHQDVYTSWWKTLSYKDPRFALVFSLFRRSDEYA